LKSASDDEYFYAGSLERIGKCARLDDELLEKAQAYTGLREKSALVREALRALIERESARRLARLGGSELDLVAAPRRRPNPE